MQTTRIDYSTDTHKAQFQEHQTGRKEKQSFTAGTFSGGFLSYRAALFFLKIAAPCFSKISHN